MGYAGRRHEVVRYRYLNPNGVQVALHRLRAEAALGKSLPSGAVVHHADGTKSERSPLVICESASYHKLLHARMRIREAGGNPNTDAICGSCRQVKDRSEFSKKRGTTFGVRRQCRECMKTAARRSQ